MDYFVIHNNKAKEFSHGFNHKYLTFYFVHNMNDLVNVPILWGLGSIDLISKMYISWNTR